MDDDLALPNEGGEGIGDDAGVEPEVYRVVFPRNGDRPGFAPLPSPRGDLS